MRSLYGSDFDGFRTRGGSIPGLFRCSGIQCNFVVYYAG